METFRTVERPRKGLVGTDGIGARGGRVPEESSSQMRRCALVQDLPAGRDRVAPVVRRQGTSGAGSFVLAGRGQGVAGVDPAAVRMQTGAVVDAVFAVALLVLMAVSAVVVTVVVVGVMAGYIG